MIYLYMYIFIYMGACISRITHVFTTKVEYKTKVKDVDALRQKKLKFESPKSTV